MNSQRRPRIMEAQLGLALLSCVLVVIGYVVLERLGDDEPLPLTTDIGASRPIRSPAADVAHPPSIDQARNIVPTQGAQSVPAPFPHISQRPLWLAPEQDEAATITHEHEPSAPDDILGEPSLFQPQSVPVPQVPNATQRY